MCYKKSFFALQEINFFLKKRFIAQFLKMDMRTINYTIFLFKSTKGIHITMCKGLELKLLN